MRTMIDRRSSSSSSSSSSGGKQQQVAAAAAVWQGRVCTEGLINLVCLNRPELAVLHGLILSLGSAAGAAKLATQYLHCRLHLGVAGRTGACHM
jgi:hypothetical protein